jgi:hypothetical protein
MKAKKVARYLLMYRQYLHDHNLIDDSDSVTAKTVINFMKDLECDELNKYKSMFPINACDVCYS